MEGKVAGQEKQVEGCSRCQTSRKILMDEWKEEKTGCRGSAELEVCLGHRALQMFRLESSILWRLAPCLPPAPQSFLFLCLFFSP